MPDYAIKQNDTSPSVAALLSYSDASLPALAGATVRFKWKPKNGGALKSGVAVIVNPATALVRYDWQPEDTAVAGEHNAEWEVTFADGRVGTFPSEGYMSLAIADDLD